MTETAVVITRYPARRGATWLREAYGMLARARLRWLGLLAIYYLAMSLIELLPFIGSSAALVLKPIFGVGFLAAAWAQERGELPVPRHLFLGFRANLWALIPLGLFLFIGIRLSLAATVLVDDGQLLDVLAGRAELNESTVASGQLQQSMLLSAACATPVLLAMFYAPALVVFHGCGVTRALSLSLKATLANWRPFTVYALLLMCFGLVVPLFVLAMCVLVLPRDAALVLSAVSLLPYFALLFAMLNIADYVSYRDIFHAGESADSASMTTTAVA